MVMRTKKRIRGNEGDMEHVNELKNINVHVPDALDRIVDCDPNQDNSINLLPRNDVHVDIEKQRA